MNWYYAEQGRQAGPVEQTELDELVRSGAVPPSALVWTEGMAEWKPYSTISAPAQAPVAAPFEFAFQTGQCVCCGRQAAAGESTTVGKNAVCFECQPAYVERLREADVVTLPGSLPFGGFWIRFTARIADYSLLNIVQSGIIATFFAWMLTPKARLDSGAWVSYGVTTLAGMLLNFAYQVYFLSTRAATPGKMICHLRVVRADGSLPLGAWTAVSRFFGEIVDLLTLGIGYLMAGFDTERRALHDRIAGTRVVDFVPHQTVEPKLEPVEREIRCASCKTEIPAMNWNAPTPIPCPGCFTPVQPIVFPAYALALPVAAPQARTGEGEASCYYHDGNRATVSCQECGRFLCPVCDLDSGSQRLCPGCLSARLAQGVAPEFVQRRTLYDSIALIAAVVPNLFILTAYLTIFTAPVVIGFSLWSWRKPGSITGRGKWRFVVAMLVAMVNLLFFGVVFTLLFASIFRQGVRR